jgi:hypothetical protein
MSIGEIAGLAGCGGFGLTVIGLLLKACSSLVRIETKVEGLSARTTRLEDRFDRFERPDPAEPRPVEIISTSHAPVSAAHRQPVV